MNTQINNKKTEIQKNTITNSTVYLYDYCFRHFATEGMKILDTHLGSGSSRISADKAKLDFTAFETNEIYFNDQEERYIKFKGQLRLELI